QPRFERRVPKLAWRMLEQPRFRASVDFLQLRAAAGMVDSVQAQWWMDFANAPDHVRSQMLDDLSRQPDNHRAAPAKRRRRRRKPAGESTDTGNANTRPATGSQAAASASK